MSETSERVPKKRRTCGVVFIDENGSILGCHSTGRPADSGFDLPKGCAEDGEVDIAAAVREVREETGIILRDGGYDETFRLVDCGVHPHNKEKDIHLYLYRVEKFPNLSELKCTSYFELNGKQIPEVDRYEIIAKDDRKKFNKVLWNKFELIDSINDNLYKG